MIVGVIAMVMMACEKEEANNEIENSSVVQPVLKEDVNNTYMNRLKLCWNVLIQDFEWCCDPIDKNCLPVVIITASTTELTADYNDFVDAIDNNAINSFFLTESNYSTLFPLLTESEQSTILNRLQTQSVQIVSEYNASDDVYFYNVIPSNVSSTSYSTSDVITTFRFDVE